MALLLVVEFDHFLGVDRQSVVRVYHYAKQAGICL